MRQREIRQKNKNNNLKKKIKFLTILNVFEIEREENRSLLQEPLFLKCWGRSYSLTLFLTSYFIYLHLQNGNHRYRIYAVFPDSKAGRVLLDFLFLVNSSTLRLSHQPSKVLIIRLNFKISLKYPWICQSLVHKTIAQSNPDA